MGLWVTMTPCSLGTMEQCRGDPHAWGWRAVLCISPTELHLKQEMGILTRSEHLPAQWDGLSTATPGG